MFRLGKIEKRVLEIHDRIYQIYDEAFDRFYDPADEHSNVEEQWLRKELEKLGTERKILLDRREGWLPKTIWMVLVPIVVSIVASILTLYVSKKLGFEIVK